MLCRARKDQVVEPIQQNCLTGKSAKSPSSRVRKNISLRRLVETALWIPPSRLERGALAIVTNVGVGCGGRSSVGRAKGIAGRVWARERITSAQTNGAEAYGKTVWFRHPLLMLNWRRSVGPTGLGQSIFANDGDKKEFVAEEIAA